MAATAAAARYDLGKGTLELSGWNRASARRTWSTSRSPSMRRAIDVTLAGPKIKAAGSVKSVLQPPQEGRKTRRRRKIPSMLKQDQPVNVIGDELRLRRRRVEGDVHRRARCSGRARRRSRATSIVIDDKTGDLSAAGPVTTTTMLEQVDKDKKKERVRSIGHGARTSRTTKRSGAPTYTGDAHLSGPQGDMTRRADRAVSEAVGRRGRARRGVRRRTLDRVREQNRKTTGTQLTYTDRRRDATSSPARR